MIFSEDAILLSLLERFEDENDVKDAVLSYCNRGAVSSQASRRPVAEQPATVAEQSEIDLVSSSFCKSHKAIKPRGRRPRLHEEEAVEPDGSQAAESYGGR